MATDKRGATIGDVQKQIAELKYKVEHGLFVEKKKEILIDR